MNSEAAAEFTKATELTGMVIMITGITDTAGAMPK